MNKEEIARIKSLGTYPVQYLSRQEAHELCMLLKKQLREVQIALNFSDEDKVIFTPKQVKKWDV